MYIPEDKKQLLRLVQDQIEVCGVSIGNRAADYKNKSQYLETGRSSGGESLANVLYAHNDRLSSFLFCPTDVRFQVGFEHTHKDNILKQAEMTARILTRAFERKNFDLTFAEGVKQGLDYGASILKITGKAQELEIDGKKIRTIKEAHARLVPPWLFGVENEGRNGLTEQESMVETVYLNKHEVWRRIWRMDNAVELYKRILSHSSKGGGVSLPSSFVQVLSTSALNISPQGSNPPSPGGIVQMTGDPLYATNGPQVISEQFQMYEIWIKDDVIGDWTMVQLIAPDIIIPMFKRENPFCEDTLPYILIQPNVIPGYFWGRSELNDLISLQAALSETMDDVKRLIGLQYDGRYSFQGFDGDVQELFEDFRGSGWIGGRQGAEVKDVTPKVPTEAIGYIKLLRETMEDVGGFGNILSGQGESGVRAGNHADTLVKTASPRLRDRSLIIERQYAAFGDTYLSYMEAKDGNEYYTDPDNVSETGFYLDQLPDDRHVMVDSHSSSPIYENDHSNLTAFGLKAGLIDGEDAIENLNFQNKDELKRKWKKREDAKAKFIQDHPELLLKAQHGGHK